MTTKITQTKTRLYQTIISEKNYSTISLLKNQKKKKKKFLSFKFVTYSTHYIKIISNFIFP